MDKRTTRLLITISFLPCVVLSIQKREWIAIPTSNPAEGDVTCFSEYMEMWIHSATMEGFSVWLSGVLQMQVNLMFLDQLNPQLSACGFSLHKDPEQNFIFRVSYTGCLVQQEHSYHVLTVNLVKRMNRFGGKRHNVIMKCPVVSVPSREVIQCDPEFFQVTRQVPYDNWDNELQWSLSLSDHLLVALADASLIQMNIDVNETNITVQGRRRDVLSPVQVMEDVGEFLALKLVGGQYAYSMEAMCPKVATSTAEETVLHIFKQYMGLTKRGSHDSSGLMVSNVSVNQTDTFTVHETSDFVTLVIPTARILHTKTCADSKQLWQPFYRVDVVLTFKETNRKKHWTMENTLPCTILSTNKVENSTAKQPPSAPPAGVDKVAPFEEMSAQFSTTISSHPQTEADMSKNQTGNMTSMFNNDTFPSFNATDFEFQTQLSLSTEEDFLEL